MIEEDQVKKGLIESLEKVNFRLEILDMIEKKLLEMKELAQRVVEEDLTEKEIHDINKQVQELVTKVDLLDSEPTELS